MSRPILYPGSNQLLKLCQQAFHFRAGMLIALPSSRRNATAKQHLRFFPAIVLCQRLRVHLIARHIIGICIQQCLKMRLGGGNVAFAQAFQRNAVARKRVAGILSEKLFQLLPAGFVLFGHRSLAYYTVEQFPAKGAAQGRAMKAKHKATAALMDEWRVKGKPVSASASEMAEVVLPAQTNALGKLLGGHVMHMVDIVAAMAASRHANSYMVTASVDYIDFRNAVNLGEIVMLRSQVNRVFTTSLEVGVEVYSENLLTGERKHTTTAFVTFVAIDEYTRKPRPVPPLILRTAEEKRRWREAAKRREIRLAHRLREKG